MQIGIDARELVGRPTGVGRFVSQLLAAWAGMADARRHRYVLYVPAPGRAAPAIDGRQWHTLEPALRPVSGSGGTWWEQGPLARAVRRDHLDVLFAPAYSAPLACGAPIVVVIHDVSFAAHPEWFRWREGVRRRRLARWSARLARIVVTISEFSKREIVTRLDVPEHRVRVVRPGIAPSPAAGRPGSSEPLVLYAGSIFNRRRLPDLIAAMREVRRIRPDARLEIVGENRSHPFQDLHGLVASAGLAGAVAIRSYVPDAELADLYGRARVFVFLSEYEGFGLTPLEALASGLPLVMLDTPVARETCGDAAWYVKRGDIGGTAAAIATLLGDEPARRRLIDRAPAILRRYSWQEAARSVLAALEDAAGGRGTGHSTV